jgi:voltage-gated potassium channel
MMNLRKPKEPAWGGWRGRVHEVIYEADTPTGKAFDIALFWAILLSVAAVMLESVPHIARSYTRPLRAMEWGFTFLFTLEYLLRLISVRQPLRYALSFFGLVDLLAIVPTYLSLILPSTRFLLVIRVLRLLRIFRVLKLARYVYEGGMLAHALRASRIKILVFLYTVLMAVVVVGAVMYVVEGEANGFTSIPVSVYWAIVTMTTVGYGDIAPGTPLGKMLASVVMIMGYGIIAVPTGIVSVELAQVSKRVTTQACPTCSREGHAPDAVFCKYCGGEL